MYNFLDSKNPSTIKMENLQTSLSGNQTVNRVELNSFITCVDSVAKSCFAVGIST